MHTPAASRNECPPRARPVRIFILNDHEPVRRGLRDLLENEGFAIAGDSGSAAEASRLTNRQIAQELLLPDEAVVACVSSVLQKLGFRRRRQLIPVPIQLAWELLH